MVLVEASLRENTDFSRTWLVEYMQWNLTITLGRAYLLVFVCSSEVINTPIENLASLQEAGVAAM